MSAFKVFPLSLPLAIQVALIEPRTHGDRGVEHFQISNFHRARITREPREQPTRGAPLTVQQSGAGFLNSELISPR